MLRREKLKRAKIPSHFDGSKELGGYNYLRFEEDLRG
jgi:hypothetical protein